MNPDAAREQAREVLSERRFAPSDVPRPFERPLHWLGDRLSALFDGLDGTLPGGGWVVWLVLAVAVLVAAALVARRTIRGRAVDGTGAVAAVGEERLDPRDLERAADAAAARGEHDAAVRLRFRAGVARLVIARAIEPTPGLTTGEIADRLRSPAFDAVGADFDAIAYGGRPAASEDDARAREGWGAVLAEGGRR